MRRFETFKRKAMKSFAEAESEGLIDKDIENHLEEFNRLKNFYTTSSCSGRIMLLAKGSGGRKNDNYFYFKTHQTADPEEIILKVEEYRDKKALWFKSEPFILHIGCRDIESARKLLAMCKKVGIKRAGINAWGERIVVEAIGTEILSTIVVKDGSMLVSKEYLTLLTNEANIRLEKTKRVLFSFFRSAKDLN